MLVIVLWFVLGGAAEWINMFTRHWTVAHMRRFKAGRAIWWVVAGFVLRLVWMALILGVATAWNPAYGIAAFIGYWLSRWLSIRYILQKGKT